jgi:hypothetical protein
LDLAVVEREPYIVGSFVTGDQLYRQDMTSRATAGISSVPAPKPTPPNLIKVLDAIRCCTPVIPVAFARPHHEIILRRRTDVLKPARIEFMPDLPRSCCRNSDDDGRIAGDMSAKMARDQTRVRVIAAAREESRQRSAAPCRCKNRLVPKLLSARVRKQPTSTRLV